MDTSSHEPVEHGRDGPAFEEVGYIIEMVEAMAQDTTALAPRGRE
jgi:hypothetical protein